MHSVQNAKQQLVSNTLISKCARINVSNRKFYQYQGLSFQA